jgi:DNA-binding response OmpR family regulator
MGKWSYLLEVGDLAIDTEKREAFIRNGLRNYSIHSRGFVGYTQLRIQPDDYKVLEMLMRHGGAVCPYSELRTICSYWKNGHVSTHVSAIRAGLDTAKRGSSKCLLTIRGEGYQLNPPE